MAKFVFLTQQETITTYDGPSGERYVILRGEPFVVKNEEDIKFFENNKRFQKVGLLKKAPKFKDKSEQWAEELEQIKGVTARTVNRMIDLYINKDNFLAEIDEGNKISDKIPKKQAESILKYYNR